MSAEFVHTHVHSDNSILDASISADELAERAAKAGMKAIALTDHGNIFGHVEFFKACQKAGVKPLLGCEFYLARRSARSDMAKFGDEANPTDHLVVLAENQEGYQNLIRLVTWANLYGFHYTPRIDLDILAAHSKGLIAQTACLSGGVNRSLIGWKARNPKTKKEEVIPPNPEEALELATRLDSIFGRGNFFLEVQNHSGPYQDDYLVERQTNLIGQVVELHKKTGIPMIGTNDIHFAEPTGARAREVAMALARNRIKTLSERPEKANHAGEFYVKNAEQMLAVLGAEASWHKNTLWVAERCNVALDLGKRRFARPVVNGKQLTDEEVQAVWEKALEDGMRHYGFQGNPAYEHRMNYEKKVIEGMGFVPYFVIIWDFIRHARSRGIPVGPSRGSGGGCLIALLLRITRLDPLKYDLLFERFLNPERVSMPDLDIDFADDRVQEVMDYLRANYGEDRVARIATFGSFWARGAIRDVGKYLELPPEEINDIANSIPESQGEFRVTLEQAIREVPMIRELSQSPEQAKKDLLAICQGLEGIKRTVSTHACGIVIGDAPLVNYMALMPQRDAEEWELLQTQADMHAVEALGLLKIDILALKALSVIGIATDLVSRKLKSSFTIDDIPLEDRETYELLSSGQTIGCFQVETNGMREVIMRIRPSNLLELSDTIALFRPGPNDAEDEHGLTMVDHYILRKHGRERVVYPHPTIEEILRPTFGVFVYQEQIIKATMVLCGYSAAQADNLRKAIGKKHKDDLIAEKEKFVPAAMAYAKLSKELAEQIWATIETFARYGFNKSHSTGYAQITVWTAFLKRHHPIEFMSALLTRATRGKRNEEDIAQYIDECYRLRIPVYSPDINVSTVDCVPEKDGIRAGLGIVKGVSASADKLVAARSLLGNSFTDFPDLISKCVEMKLGQTALSPLIRAGTCDTLGERRQLLKSLTDELKKVRARKVAAKKEAEKAEKKRLALEEGKEYKERKVKKAAPKEEEEEILEELVPMDAEELQAETLAAVNCYSIPRYPIRHLGIVCDPETLGRVVRLLKLWPGDVETTIRIRNSEVEVDLGNLKCNAHEDLLYELTLSGSVVRT